MMQGFLRLNRFFIESPKRQEDAMAYTASQNPKTGTTYTAAVLFAALAMHPAEAFAKPLCDENGPCYASSR